MISSWDSQLYNQTYDFKECDFPCWLWICCIFVCIYSGSLSETLILLPHVLFFLMICSGLGNLCGKDYFLCWWLAKLWCVPSRLQHYWCLQYYWNIHGKAKFSGEWSTGPHWAPRAAGKFSCKFFIAASVSIVVQFSFKNLLIFLIWTFWLHHVFFYDFCGFLRTRKKKILFFQ